MNMCGGCIFIADKCSNVCIYKVMDRRIWRNGDAASFVDDGYPIVAAPLYFISLVTVESKSA